MSEFMELVLPSEIQQAAGPSAQHRITNTIIPQEEHKAKPKKKICRFFQAVWKAVKRPFKLRKNKVEPLELGLFGGGIHGTNDSDPAANRSKDATHPVNAGKRNDSKPDDTPALMAAMEQSKTGLVINPVANDASGPAAKPHEYCHGKRTCTNPGIPKAGTGPANPKKKPVAKTVKQHLKVFTTPKTKPEVIQKPMANAELKNQPTPCPVNNSKIFVLDKYSYELSKMIGKGSFGQVYKGVRHSDGRMVAVKHIKLNPKRAQYIEIPEYPQPLLTEVALMLKLQQSPISPFVIQMYDWQVEPDYATIVLEYGYSETLHLYISSQYGSKLTEIKARGLIYQAVSAVKHCLEHGVFHSDLHSGNFLVDRFRMNLKLIDFGCAHVLRETGYTSKTFKGALRNRPPEAFTGQIYHAVPTNVWSLGVLLYMMLHGFWPFPKNKIPTDEDFQICEPDLSEDVCHLMTQCLAIDPDQRPTISKILEHPWFVV